MAKIRAKEVVETWRGWQGHFICECYWHLNTLLDLGGFKIVVSTVGMYKDQNGKHDTIGLNRYWETMAFESDYGEWDDINVSKQVYFDSEWAWANKEDEKLAQAGHYKVVEEIKAKMLSGEITKDSWKCVDGFYSFVRSIAEIEGE